MSRLADNDKSFGPITVATSGGWKPWRFVISSDGSDEEDSYRNSLTIYAFGGIMRIYMPNIIRPYRIKHKALSWSTETIERLGRDWYYEVHPREYGFSLSEGFLQIFFGAQTGDSLTTQDWCCNLPWTRWRHIRHTLYTPNGEHFWTQLESNRDWNTQHEMQEKCPSVKFLFDDYDGQRITATCRIDEREWRFGEGWFKWLSWFRKPEIARSLDLKFDKEVGPEKGSWKGGTVGHSIEMLPNESCEDAFRRYCTLDHERKGKKFALTFVGAA